MINIYIDGASRGNPGEAGIGIIIKTEDGSTLYSAAGYTGKMTNNQAEYNALIAALTKLKKSPALYAKSGQDDAQGVIIHSDSELVVRQLTGQYRVKENELKKLHHAVQELTRSIPVAIEFRHIRRELNREADRLANMGIDAKIPLSI
jgi:ribonuclease HI